MGLFQHHQFPVYSQSPGEVDPQWFHAADTRLARVSDEAGIRPWQFWRAIPLAPFSKRNEVRLADRYDDSGRPLLAGQLFRLLGGVSPMLLFWLGLLATAPVLIWIAWEFRAAGYALAGAVFLLLVGASPYVAETLALSYSPVGFQLVGLLVLVALTVFAFLGPRPSPAGLALRLLLGGAAFAAAALCRAGCLLVLPGLALALWVAAFRTWSFATRRRRLTAATLGVVLFLTPYLTARSAAQRLIDRTIVQHGGEAPPQQHALWFAIWAGLGDFDRAKGYRWRDRSAATAAVAAGGYPVTPAFYDFRNEPIFRRLVLNDIRNDPLWYLAILGKRLLATLTLRKLWPWGPLDGRSLEPATTPNEGQMDSYYALTTTADFLVVLGRRREVPIPLLLLPASIVVALTLGDTALRRRDPHAMRRRGAALTLMVVAVGAVAPPVLITTASALEPQAFVLVHFLGAAFLAEELLWWMRTRPR